MSQKSHTLYKQMIPIKGKYYKLKRSGTGGIRQDCYEQMLDKYKYDYLKIKLDYLTVDKHDDWYERLSIGNTGWGLTVKQQNILNKKMETDTELVTLRRIVKILKIKLLKTGYKPEYL